MSNKFSGTFVHINDIKTGEALQIAGIAFVGGALGGIAISDYIVYTPDKDAYYRQEAKLDKLHNEVHTLEEARAILEHDYPPAGEAGPGHNPSGFETTEAAVDVRQDRIATVEAKQNKVGYDESIEIAGDLGFGFAGLILVGALAWAGITRRHRRQLAAQPKRLPIRTY